MISRVSGKWTMYFSSLHGHAAVLLGAPTECRQGTKSPSSPRQSSAGLPMRVMIRIETATYGESVSWTPISAIGDPSGPMLNGTTYIVWPRMLPRNFSVSSSRISAGSRQWLVGPASSSFSEQMNVRSSTRATSLGSDSARYEFGRLKSFSRSNVPASTIRCAIRSYSSEDPSHQCTASGCVSSDTSSTHCSSFLLDVRASVSMVTGLINLSCGGEGDHGTFAQLGASGFGWRPN